MQKEQWRSGSTALQPLLGTRLEMAGCCGGVASIPRALGILHEAKYTAVVGYTCDDTHRQEDSYFEDHSEEHNIIQCNNT